MLEQAKTAILHLGATMKMTASIISSFFFCFNAFAIEPKTMRHPLCGVELYYSKVDEKCGAGLYFEKKSSSCEVESFIERRDKACGTEVQNVEICLTPPGCQTCEVKCHYEPREIWKTCRLPLFGVESYKSCRHPSHGIEVYSSCRLPEFGIEQYRLCSFYKTPEEIDAYISEVSISAETFAQLLPMRQAELFSKVRDEKSFKCLIEKYEGRDFIEEIVKDLKDKFFLIFGFKYTESEIDCAQAVIDTDPEIRAGQLNCADYSYDTLNTLSQPSTMSSGLFNNFVKKCQAKIVYDNLSAWFTSKKEEISLLENDLAAKDDPTLKRRLLDLKAELDHASN